MIKFLVTLSAYSLLLFAFCKLAEDNHWWETPRHASTVIISLAILTAILYFILVYFQNRSDRFPLAYMASITLKLIFGIGFLVFLIRRHPQEGYSLGALFLASYLGFTAIEVFFLRKRLLK